MKLKSEEAMAEIGAGASDVEAVTRPKRKKIRAELIRETISNKDEGEVASDSNVSDESSNSKVVAKGSVAKNPKKVIPKRKPRPRPGQRSRQKPVDNSNKEK
ncbi:MAG: hypothetical protein U9N32_05875, partial [Spirochaetota bacterium]|nr:hypothetical protein [Spirochaetota bacterium]